MRILVDGRSLGGGSRMPVAAAGLALRGHEVHWLGPAGAVPAGVTLPVVRGLLGLPGRQAEVVVGGGGAAFPAALAGWLAGARVMVLDLSTARLDRWRWLDRWAWDSIYAAGLVDDAEAPMLSLDTRGLERERIGLWPAVAPAGAPDPAHPDSEVLERACERALARERSRIPRPAVFLDRDGTLIRETGYLADPDAVELLPGAARALRDLAAAGYPLVVVSNQSGIARGLFSEARVHATMARLRAQLRARGVELTAIYFCPHHPEQGCPCRKPRPGLLERAADDLGLLLERSVMIGDKRIDAVAGREAGGRGVLVRTGYGREEERAGGGAPVADRVCEDLPGAAEWLLESG